MSRSSRRGAVAARFLASVAFGLAIALLVPRSFAAPPPAPAGDLAGDLKELLQPLEPELDKVRAALTAAAEAGDVDAIGLVVDAFDRYSENASKAEIDAAKAEADLAAAKEKSDETAAQDKRTTLEKAQKSGESGRGALEVLAAGIAPLLEGVAQKNAGASVPPLVRLYESESERVTGLERKDEEQKGKLAQASSRAFELEGNKEADKGDLTRVRSERAEAQATVDRTEATLAFHQRARRLLADAAARLMKSAKGAEVDDELKKLDKRVDGKASADERVKWIDLYARLGREEVPGELTDVALDATKALKKGDPELEKLRDQFQKAKDAFFREIETGGGTVRVTTKQAFEGLQKQLQAAGDELRSQEKIRAVAARAVGTAIASLPAEKRATAIVALMNIARGDKDVETRAGLLEGCGALDELSVRDYLRKALVEDRDVRARLAALEALVTLKDGDAMEIVRARLLAHDNWKVRAAAVSALVRVPQKESVPALIQALAVEVGRLKEDITDGLQRLTGQGYAMAAEVWKKWWDDSGANFVLPTAEQRRRLAVSAWDQATTGKVTFYGISSISKRVCFVLDVSKSMDEAASKTAKAGRRKIDVAKDQLKQAITGLGDGDQFAIVVFAGTASRWAPKMTTVTTSVKQKVLAWIDNKLELGSGTNIHDGMKEAFGIAGMGARDAAYESAIDTMFFLSDGDATVGEVTDPLEIRREIREWNRLSRLKIHCIGVGEAPNIALLYGIAEDSGGQFQHR